MSFDEKKIALSEPANMEEFNVEIHDDSKLALHREVLQVRARALAKKPAETTRADDSIELLLFVLSGSEIAMESTFVREVLPLKEITPLPCTPSFVLGIINARGQILSVIDIKRFFDLNHQALSNLNKIVVIKGATTEFGILVDEVIGMTNLPLDEIKTPPAAMAESYGDYLKGVTEQGLMVLNVGRILNDERLVIDEEVH